ncbi:uncharacterized protein L969DRAFT_87068 [Mixia osmundae IAM 14324]|uniref:3-hydroxyacyl-CoA dehydrogenase n=1 Tax=Mixia osmundae (strain CBS 9802 / IAM 14324 / JCM 22182 / KY 12970) TaxID=764103 RepID=G7E6G5_MIXOS|nr:uncharacterized protein L969DRAFT_87068 [Mixia osmundae IAM 14324]KEI40418.1 hypothetical protein L969DRAFT_87068 [Mixia osmundae IAM 14324]GAA98425.1 hypothetical protein E5Q_05111 [Mixia osmundae IAM 14324]
MLSPRMLRPSVLRSLQGCAVRRSFATSAALQKDINHMTVFGAGLMGAGIVQVAAQNGIKVVMTDVSDKALENGKKIITKSLTRIARKAHPEDEAAQKSLIDKVFENISTSTSPDEAVKSSDLVLEAIVENIKVKQELFSKLDKSAPKDAIFASNTSSLSITDIAQSTEPSRQWIGWHWFNPPPQMKLVEIIKTEKTSEETYRALADLSKRMKKTAVSCKDTPGFIVNRLLVPYMLEAVRMVERGEASAEDVDVAMKLGAGYPMGPFELSDFVGLDTLSHISRGWRDSRVETGEISAEAVKESPLLEQLVKENKLGRKTGEGFRKYD